MAVMVNVESLEEILQQIDEQIARYTERIEAMRDLAEHATSTKDFDRAARLISTINGMVMGLHKAALIVEREIEALKESQDCV